MKIIEVRAFLMSGALPEPLPLPFWGGERTILKRDAMLIRVKADNGLTGYAPGPAHERAAKEVHEVIAPFLIGKDPRRWKEFGISRTALPLTPALAPPEGERENRRHLVGKSGAVTETDVVGNSEERTSLFPLPRRGGEGQGEGATSNHDLELPKTYRAVEIALIDLAARFEGCAMSELIGGRKRDRIKLYGSAGMYISA